MSWLFSSKPKLSPKEQVRAWSNDLKKQQRSLQRDVARIEREEAKATAEIKRLAKQGHSAALKTMAKGLVQSRMTKARLLEGSARINSVILSLKTHQATQSVVDHLGRSSEVMKSMSSMLSLPELRETARNLSKEMAKAGLIEEMVEEGLSDAFDTDELEAEAEQQVNQVIDEIVSGTFQGVDTIKGKNTEKAQEAEEDAVAEEEHKKELAALQERIGNLS